MQKRSLKETNVNHVAEHNATQPVQVASIAQENELSTTKGEIATWLEQDEKKKAKAIFKAKLKYGEHYNGVTHLPMGGRITVVKGQIKVQP